MKYFYLVDLNSIFFLYFDSLRNNYIRANGITPCTSSPIMPVHVPLTLAPYTESLMGLMVYLNPPNCSDTAAIRSTQ